MTGICLAGGAPDASARVDAMLAHMDQEGGFRTGALSLGPDLAAGRAFRGRLASEHPPAEGPGGVTVLIDGEIFDEDGPLARPEDRIAELYRSERLDRIAWLNGSFAAAIIDRAKDRVVVASDRLGSRPLFVWQNGRGFGVASRLDALLADDRVPRRLSTQGLIETLSLQRTTGDQTQYADIHASRAAELWTLRNGNLERRHTRRLAWKRPDFDEREGAERLAAGLQAAVARRTSDRVRHGLLLSGGLDARTVLAAAANGTDKPECLTAGPWRNQEVALAEASAGIAGAPFRFLENPPARLSTHFDAATRASDGLFTAPVNLFGLLPEMARCADVLLSGHGLDYTLRGYYLPCRMVRLAGSVTRLPRLRAIPDGSAETLVRNLRVGISAAAVSAILLPDVAQELEERKLRAFRRALAAADIDDPYNAWDAYILSCLGRHYAWSDFVAMESVIAHRAIAFDPEVFDLYLAMPPAWRASGRMAQRAMILLNPKLMSLPDANTRVRARYPFMAQIGLVFANAVLRKLGLKTQPALPDPTMSHGSWANFPELLRRDPIFLDRLHTLPSNPALLDTGLFRRDGLETVVNAHLGGEANHVKLLLQLLTMASWLEQHPYDGVVDDR